MHMTRLYMNIYIYIYIYRYIYGPDLADSQLTSILVDGFTIGHLQDVIEIFEEVRYNK